MQPESKDLRTRGGGRGGGECVHPSPKADRIENQEQCFILNPKSGNNKYSNSVRQEEFLLT